MKGYTEKNKHTCTICLFSLLCLLFCLLTIDAQEQVPERKKHPVKYQIPPQFEAAGMFREGLAPVKKDGKWGFVDTKGRFRIDPSFEKASSLSEGLAGVCKEGKWGFINRWGEFLIQPQYDGYHGTGEGLMCVCLNDKWGYINAENEVQTS